AVHFLLQTPAVARLELPLYARQLLQGSRLVRLLREVVEARQQLAGLRQAAGHVVVDALLALLGQFLLQGGHHQAGPRPELAAVRLHLAGQQFHESGLAGAVAAKQANALASLDDEVDMIEHHVSAEGKVDVGEAKQGHGRIHGWAWAGAARTMRGGARKRAWLGP